jgi:hypothetical protein
MRMVKALLVGAALLLSAGFGSLTVAQAQGQLLDSYVTFIGPNDHFNSKGGRLTEPWQIVRQDRANYHRFRVRDPGDEGDIFFSSMANRGRMERMILNGYINPNAAWRIVNENVWIQVEIYPNAVNVTVQ